MLGVGCLMLWLVWRTIWKSLVEVALSRSLVRRKVAALELITVQAGWWAEGEPGGRQVEVQLRVQVQVHVQVHVQVLVQVLVLYMQVYVLYRLNEAKIFIKCMLNSLDILMKVCSSSLNKVP